MAGEPAERARRPLITCGVRESVHSDVRVRSGFFFVR